MLHRVRRTTPQRRTDRLAVLASRLPHIRTHLFDFSSPLRVSHTALSNILLSIFCIAFTLLAPTIHAQTSTITPDSTLPMPSTVATLDSTHTITEGTAIGPNLFHSFRTFHLGDGDTANFVNPGGIENILSRVTGGEASNLYGELRSDSSANLFFLNPNGIMFGPEAKLNIAGSFHVSTADSIQLGTGTGAGVFSAIDPASDILSSAPPTAFGFLNPSPGSIDISSSTLHVPDGEVLSVVGGDIGMKGGNLTAPNGQIVLASLKGPDTTVSLSQPLDTTENAQLGGIIQLSEGSVISASGDGGGTVVIRGGSLMMEQSNILASVTPSEDNSFGGTLGSGVDIVLTRDLVLDAGSTIETNVSTSVETVGSGGVRVQAENVKILNQSYIQSNVFFGSTGGPAGDIEVDADSVFIQTENFFVGALEAGTNSSSDGGSIRVQATDSLDILEGSFIWTFAAGAGKAGDIAIDAGDVTIASSRSTLPDFTAITSQNFVFDSSQPVTGDIGDIRMTADSLKITNAEISTPTFLDGDAGDIDLAIKGDISIAGDPSLFAGVFTNTFGNGKGGNLMITGNNLILTNHASLQAGTFGSGDAGETNITLEGDLVLENGSVIQSRSAEDATGSAGNLDITAQDILILGISDATNFEVSPEFTGISASTFNGLGGNVTINAKSLSIKDKAFVNTATFGPHPSGDITIRLSGDLAIDNGGQIFANTRSSGNGGQISIQASNVVVSGVNPVPSVTLDERTVIAKSAITSRSQGGNGTGGDIQVTADQISVLDGAAVTAESTSSGPAGNITLAGNNSIVITDGEVTTQAENAEGGVIELKAQDLIQFTNSEITSRVRTGSDSAGKIDIDPDFVVIQNSDVLSTAVFGDGGPITITANSAILVDPFSNLDASSQFGGDGSVDIQAPIQQLSGAIAPLPEDLLKLVNLYSEACASQKGGQFSSLVKNTDSTVSPIPGGFLSSPLAFNTSDTSPSLPTKQASVTSTSNSTDPPALQQWLGQLTWTIFEPNLSSTPFQVCSRKMG